ncbi:hypothetical protein ACVWWG_007711 [Bradyrhizobium sp. LB7.2]
MLLPDNRGIRDSMARQTVIPKKKRGPAPTGKGVPVMVRLQPDDLAAVDDWIAKQDDALTRPEAIRRLVEIGLSTDKEKRKKQ